MDIEQFKKIQEYKKIGLSQVKTKNVTGFSLWDIRKFWNYSESEFKNYLLDIESDMSSYYAYIVDILKTTPTIPDTNIYYKLKEDFLDFQVSESTFRRYIRKIRKELGYDRFRKKNTSIRATPIPGEEAQIDFGQSKITDMYGKKRIVYFFIMVLRYSQLKYVYFQTVPFNTTATIQAHKFAFDFFGGVPKVLLYDQDRVFLVSENYGNLILAKEFEDFLKQHGLTIVMSSGYYPQTKGTVENYVKIVKNNFLEGRIYYGIDSLNSACLEWLDNTENNHILVRKGVTPHVMFMKERRKLRKIKIGAGVGAWQEYTVYDNYILYKKSKYEVPLGYSGMKVRVENDDNSLVIYDLITDDVLASYEIAIEKDERKTIAHQYVEGAGEMEIKAKLKHSADALAFLDNFKKQKIRYYKKCCIKIKQLLKIYTIKQIEQAFIYCNKEKDYSILGLIGFLIYKYGDELGHKSINLNNYSYYKRKANFILEELNGN